ncbi:glycosyltransferase [Pseudoalteromonas rubra]|nr:glycosyltransferase [Pseudoalteromonas rubra]
MPFLNEGDNVRKTLESIKATITSDIEIILINDASDDGYDYEKYAKIFEAEYIRNSFRIGVAACRELGIKIASYDNIVLLDAHMQFYDSGWDTHVAHLIQSDPRTIFCSKSVHLNTDWEKVEAAPLGCGVYIPVKEPKDFQHINWLLEPTQDLTIPCIYGAFYCFRKAFYEEIGGLVGLLEWGGDEQFLSAKAFMAGGRCALIPELAVGHVYRESCPYAFTPALNLYNQLYIASVLQPEDQAQQYVAAILAGSVLEAGNEGVMQMLSQSAPEIAQHRAYYLEHLSTRSFSDFLAFNREFVDRS